MEKPRIMIVEDNKIISMEIKQRIEGMGFEAAAVVTTGEEAILMAKEKIPDLVLMDIELKGSMDGIEAAEQIRALNIPTIYVTSYSDDYTIQRAESVQKSGYVVKPVEDDELQNAITRTLQNHKSGIV